MCVSASEKYTGFQMISSNYLTSVVLFQYIVLCGNTQPNDTRSRLKQIAAAGENPLTGNYDVLMILNCSESLDSHLCGEGVLRGPGLSKPRSNIIV